MSWERWESSGLGRWERYMRVLTWQGGKGGRIVEVARSERWEGSEVASWERLEGIEVAR